VTSEDIRGELERVPFRPLRIHMVSGKTVEVPHSAAAWLLRNSVLVFQPSGATPDDTPYDMIAMRNIERLEHMPHDRG
jgi:hypothetical protein